MVIGLSGVLFRGNGARNFKLAKCIEQGRFEITSTITPELYDTKSNYQLHKVQLPITKYENDNLHKLLFTSAENITKYFISTRKMEKRNKIMH